MANDWMSSSHHHTAGKANDDPQQKDTSQPADSLTTPQGAPSQTGGSSQLSLALALTRPTIWSNVPRSPNWPTDRGFKHAGPARAMIGEPRQFPFPLTEKVDDQFISFSKRIGMPLSGPGVLRSYRKPADWAVKGFKSDCPMQHQEAEIDELAEELELSEVNETVRELIERIDGMEEPETTSSKG